MLIRTEVPAAGRRKCRSAAFEAGVAEQTRTIADLAGVYQVHPVHLGRRRKRHLNGAERTG